MSCEAVPFLLDRNFLDQETECLVCVETSPLTMRSSYHNPKGCLTCTPAGSSYSADVFLDTYFGAPSSFDRIKGSEVGALLSALVEP